MRKLLLGIVAATTAAGCVAHADAPSGPDGELKISPSPATPFTLVTAGEVHGVFPDGWYAFPADPVNGIRGGFVASPRAGGWPDIDGTSVGMAATWVDATRVGVPSDYYYLAANGPLLSRITTSTNCRGAAEVYLDRRPTFDPARPSPGHFMAEGEGTCRRGTHLTRYAYFVAAPGYGPVHELGIPASGLYVVVAVVPQERGAGTLLHDLLRQTRFGDDGIRDFVASARTGRTHA